MLTPQDHVQEPERLKELDSYSILDTLPEIDYDNITTIAAAICGTPISLISLVDDKRQWFKSSHGLAVSETPKEYAFCAHVINNPDDVFIVQDARTDERFHDNPLVTGDPHVIFYVGVPLLSDNGLPLGTLCVIDHQPKLLNKDQIHSLSALSNQVMNLLKLRRNKVLLEEALMNLKEKNEELERFAFIAAHDLKSPLIDISNLAQLFTEDYGSSLDKEGQVMLGLIEESSNKLRRLIDGLLESSRSEKILLEEVSTIDINDLRNELVSLFPFDSELSITFKSSLDKIYANKTALDQILLNLVANAIKYNDKNKVEIEVGVSEHDTAYRFYVQDNGPGIAPELQEKIFKMFEIGASHDKHGNVGSGIGLATVKKLVEKLGGTIGVESTVGEGAKFIFSLKK